MNNILYIEDDQEIKFVKGDLEDRGYMIIWLTSSYNYETYIEKADLIVLDIMMPGLDGFTIGQRMKNTSADPALAFNSQNGSGR